MKWYFLTDLHLGYGQTDDHNLEFSKEVFKKAHLEDAGIILGGDTCDVDQARFEDIYLRYRVVFDYLDKFSKEKKKILVGNHDLFLFKYMINSTDFMNCGVPQTLIRLNRSVLLYHGHEADTFCKNPASRAGNWLVGLLERRINKDIDKEYFKMAERVGKLIPPADPWYPGDYKEYTKLARAYKSNSGDIRLIFQGHTHLLMDTPVSPDLNLIMSGNMCFDNNAKMTEGYVVIDDETSNYELIKREDL